MRHGRWVLALVALGVAGVALGMLWRQGPSSGRAATDWDAAAAEGLGTEPVPAVPLTVEQKARLQVVVEGAGDFAGFPGVYDQRHFVPLSPKPKMHLNGIYPGTAWYESFSILHSSRVRWLLSVGMQDRKAVGRLMEKILRGAMEAWPEAREEELAMLKSGEIGRGMSRATPIERVRAQAEMAIYVLGEMRYHEGLKALYESYRKQQEWTDAVPEEKCVVFLPPCPVGPPMSLFALHRLIAAYPEAGLGEKSLQALRAYKQWAETQVPVAETYRLVYDEPAAGGTGAFPTYRVEYVHEWPVAFRDGTGMQKYSAAPYGTERTKEWFGLMQAFVESLP